MNKRDHKAELAAMDQAALDSVRSLLEMYGSGTPGDIVAWLREYMPRAGYKRLCRILLAVERLHSICDACYSLGHPAGGPECPECGAESRYPLTSMDDLR